MATVHSKLVQQLTSETTEVPITALSRFWEFGALAARGATQALAERIGRYTSYVRPNPHAAEKTVKTLGRLKGLPMKIGQLSSYADPTVDEGRRATLAVLQRWAQPIAYEHMREIIVGDFGKQGEELLSGMDQTPVAVASIGQVYQARLKDGTIAAVKIKYPGIDQAIEQDFRPASVSARLFTWLDQPAQRDVLVGEMLDRLKEECDYSNEARRQQHFTRLFADHPTVLIPEVIEAYCSSRVLTTRWIEGVHFDEFLESNPNQDQRDRAGTALFDFYYGSLFAYGVYNCDPHPGNYIFCPDGRLAILDHGCARVFDPSFVKYFSSLIRAVKQDDDQAIRTALLELGVIQSGQPYNHDRARRLLQWFFGPLLRGRGEPFRPEDARVRDLLQGSRLRHFAIPAELLFLLRMRVGMAAVLAKLQAKADWQKMQDEYLEEAKEQLSQPKPFAKKPRGYDVVLVDPGERIIELIRELRDYLEITISDAKKLADQVPSTIKPALRRVVAEDLQAKLESLGARVELWRAKREI
jgi:predicted unusual protein kinase regulating ubiquinone biosynthesis (AarF/ABC1/UbiB family)